MNPGIQKTTSTSSSTANPLCKCGEERRRGGRYCLKCHASKQRKWRKRHPLTKIQRMKMNARAFAHVYVKRGLIKKLPCRECGNPKSEIHHADYSKPTQITWLCRNHHLALHRQ